MKWNWNNEYWIAVEFIFIEFSVNFLCVEILYKIKCLLIAGWVQKKTNKIFHLGKWNKILLIWHSSDQPVAHQLNQNYMMEIICGAHICINGVCVRFINNNNLIFLVNSVCNWTTVICPEGSQEVWHCSVYINIQSINLQIAVTLQLVSMNIWSSHFMQNTVLTICRII